MNQDSLPPLTRDQILAGTAKPIPRWIKLACAVLGSLGMLVFLFGAFTGNSRAWQAFHFNWLFFTTVSSAAVVFVAVQRITTARWSRPIVRFLEGYVAFLPVAFVFLLLIVLAGKRHIFPWVTEPIAIHEKQIYLNLAFFIPRVILAFAIIAAMSVWYIYTSVRLDVGLVPEAGAAWARGLRERIRRGYRDERREIHSTHSLQGKLAVGLGFAFVFGWTVLAWDLSMSLDVHFQSTMYGWWVFMGGWVVSLMSWTILCMAWRKHLDRHDLVTENHFHDLGKLCFAFSAFWGYLSFGQYLVIWYGNLGEETHWMRLRLIAPWKPLTLAVAAMMFFIPFFGLLSRKAKVYLPTMALFATSSIIGLWLHRYVEIYPSIYAVIAGVPFGIWEVAIGLGYLGIWGLCYSAFMDAFPRMRVTLMTSPYRDEVQIPVNAETMEPLPAHE